MKKPLFSSMLGLMAKALSGLSVVVALCGSTVATFASPSEPSLDLIQLTAPWKFLVGRWDWRTEGSKPILAQTEAVRLYAVALSTKHRWQDVDVSMQFRALSGDIDASGGIVFRAQDEKNYYVVRANCLENNFRLYTVVDGIRSQIAGATVPTPALKQWQSVRVVVQGDRIEAYLNGKLLIKHHDTTFQKGYVGLWTKADSVTEFADMKAMPIKHISGSKKN